MYRCDQITRNYIRNLSSLKILNGEPINPDVPTADPYILHLFGKLAKFFI